MDLSEAMGQHSLSSPADAVCHVGLPVFFSAFQSLMVVNSCYFLFSHDLVLLCKGRKLINTLTSNTLFR